MKKKFFATILTMFILACSSIPALAQDMIGVDKAKGVAGASGYKDVSENFFPNTIGVIINTVMTFVGMLFLVFMIYAGYLWMTARGEDEQTKKATGIIKNSIIGLIILLSAYAISNFIMSRINK